MLKKVFLVFIISVLLLISLGFVSLQVSEYIKSVTLEKFNDQQLILARQSSEGISSFIEHICKNLEYYAESPEIETRNMKKIYPFLNRIYSRELLNIINIIITYKGDPSPIFFPDLITSPGFFIDELEKTFSQKTTVTDYFLVLDGLPSIVINTPLKRLNFPDKIYGYFSTTISLSRIEKLFISKSIPTDSSKIYLLDKNFRILISNDELSIGTNLFEKYNFNKETWLRYISEHKNKFTDNLSETKYVIAHTPVMVLLNQWHLVIITPRDVALSNLQPWLQKMTRFILVITLLILLLYSLLSLFVMSSHKKEAEALEKIRTAEERERLQREIKRREEFLTNILSSTQDMVFTISKDSRFTFVNKRMVETLGLPEEKIKTESVFDYLGVDDKKVLEKYIAFSDYNSTPLIHDCSFNLSNRTLSVILSIAPVISYDNETSFVCVITDVTEIKHLQARLYQADKMVTLGTMAGGIAHEINNPLCSVLGFAKMGIKKSDEINDSVLKKYFASIHKAAEHSKNIIDNLLRYASNKGFSFYPVNLIETLDNSLMLLEKSFESSDISFIKEYPAENIFVLGDENQLQQVFTNISVNAINAMPDGGTFVISIKINHKESSSEVVISFKDTGVGISKENISKIFDPFFTTKPIWSGTGLGLSISQTIIKEHKGRIEVESELNKGSSFFIYLPLHKIEKEVRR
ncbi:MAG: ATP-binding protein [Candidatus Hydrogenedentota bacterium]